LVAGQQWREAANDAVRVRFHAACHAEWRAEREAVRARRWGSKGLTFRDDKRDAERAEAERRREEGKTVVSIGWGGPDDGKTIEHEAGT
jgi:hypothetical protein